MNEVLKIELAVALYCLVEAVAEYNQIKTKSPSLPNYKIYDKREHTWSLIKFFAVLVLPVFLNTDYYKLLPSLIFDRRLVFDYFLKVFRKRPFKKIEGTLFFDNFSRNIFGANGGYLELIAVSIIKTLSLFLFFKFS